MVEDEEAHIELVSRAFAKHSDKFHMVTARTLSKAKEYLSEKTPDLVLTDLLLPDGLGTELIPSCGEDPPFPLVVMTSHGDEQAAVNAMKSGVQDYIVKSEITLRDMPHLATQTLREWDHLIERKRAETSLSEEKERLAVTLRSIGDAVITTDANGTITLLNKVAEDLIGCKQEEAIGKPLDQVFRIINENTRERCENPVVKVLESGGIVGLANNTVLIGKDDKEIVIEDSGAPILDKHNRTLGVVLVFRDVTEKRRIEQELQRAQKLESLGILAGGIAHDFNNSLTAIIGNISLAKLYAKPEGRVLEKLEEIEKAAMRTKDLTQQLLTFSKGGEPIKRIISIGELVKETATFALRGSKVRCRFDFSDGLLPVKVDPGQIGQVVNNIILNADQSMPAGGIIEITAENFDTGASPSLPLKAGRYVKISVKDHGIGIPKEHLTKIFDPYFTTKQKGSGIGLAIAYSIAEKHDGYITVESQISVGSTFHVYLPAAKEPLPKERAGHIALYRGSGKVLLMDDEEDIRTVSSEMLTALGYEVVCAHDGAEAADLFRQAHDSGKPFESVILDLTIPGGMGGQDVIREILEIDPSAAVIVSSGYSNDPVMSDYKKYGFHAAMSKPYRIQELSKTLQRVIEEKRGKTPAGEIHRS